ncbi:MAG: FecR domain-containing protein [Prolixibacteraceae bacterium]|nr:FecR domain-containing protein [Prolixibacteraceae bacterium]
MENKFRDKKAEDILTDENLVEELKQDEILSGKATEKELVLARQIAKAVNHEKVQLGAKQKAKLGQRVSDSIETYKRRKLIVKFSYAAVLILIVGISVLFRSYSDSDIRRFALKNNFGPVSGNTRLFLSGEKEVQINSNESKIEYQGEGNEVRIDATQDIRQNVDNDETVMNTVIVPYGKRAQITLADNSKIWLNSGSKLIYPARFASDKREVYLEGEAIFEVSHNKKHPFIVITSGLDVKVLGTVFNVSSYRDDQTTSTILESGSVELSYKSNSVFGRSKELMVPGMLAIYDPQNGNVSQSKVNTRHYTSWREGYFVFEKQPLGGILKKISRYYNVSVRLSDEELGKETFSGNLDLKNSPDQVLKIIAELINAKVENIDNQIVITRI